MTDFLMVLADRILALFETDEELKAAAIDFITAKADHERALAEKARK